MRRPGWMNPVGQWFGPKLIGWGASPRTWEGWVLTGLTAALIVAAARTQRG